MFLQILTEHQGHVVIKIAATIAVMTGLLLLAGFIGKKRMKSRSPILEIQNFDEQSRRQKRKGRYGGNKSDNKSKRKK